MEQVVGQAEARTPDSAGSFKRSNREQRTSHGMDYLVGRIFFGVEVLAALIGAIRVVVVRLPRPGLAALAVQGSKG